MSRALSLATLGILGGGGSTRLFPITAIEAIAEDGAVEASIDTTPVVAELDSSSSDAVVSSGIDLVLEDDPIEADT